MAPINFERNNLDKNKKKTRFQFFNSSEKRFKELSSLNNEVKQKPSLQKYLNQISSP